MVSLSFSFGIGGGACYDPSIRSGGLLCAPGDKPCPDGFRCGGNGRCVSSDSPGGTGGGNGGGTGGAGGMCQNAIAPLCQPSGGGSGACDPVCQTGCACGLRCNVSGSTAACAAPQGQKTVGQICALGADDCAPGLVCMRERCGADLGRCYRFCRNDDSSCICNTDLQDASMQNTNFRVCDLAAQMCNPYAQTGCPNQSLRCYALGPSQTICACPGDPSRERQEGQSCSGFRECALGLACLEVGGSARCVRLCQGTSNCATCMPLGNISFCGL
jgi:hypothetical protein